MHNRPPARAPDVQPLPPSCAAHEAAVRAQPRFATSYGAASFALVEMAPVLAYQAHVVRIAIDPAMQHAAPGRPIDQALLDRCLPPTLKTVTPRWRLIGGAELGSISFYCGTEFEFRLLAAGLAPPNPVEASQLVGVTIGMGNGLVHIWREGANLYLVNGYHRVANLLRSGHQYVPCAIRDMPPGSALQQGGLLGVQLNQAVPPATCGDYVRAVAVPSRRSHKVINLNWSQMVVPDE